MSDDIVLLKYRLNNLDSSVKSSSPRSLRLCCRCWHVIVMAKTSMQTRPIEQMSTAHRYKSEKDHGKIMCWKHFITKSTYPAKY